MTHCHLENTSFLSRLRFKSLYNCCGTFGWVSKHYSVVLYYNSTCQVKLPAGMWKMDLPQNILQSKLWIKNDLNCCDLLWHDLYLHPSSWSLFYLDSVDFLNVIYITALSIYSFQKKKYVRYILSSNMLFLWYFIFLFIIWRLNITLCHFFIFKYFSRIDHKRYRGGEGERMLNAWGLKTNKERVSRLSHWGDGIIPLASLEYSSLGRFLFNPVWKNLCFLYRFSFFFLESPDFCYCNNLSL
jgi:hypothetical protein